MKGGWDSHFLEWFYRPCNRPCNGRKIGLAAARWTLPWTVGTILSMIRVLSRMSKKLGGQAKLLIIGDLSLNRPPSTHI